MPDGKLPSLVPLAEAQRICFERLGMTPAQFRHELAEYMRGSGGIPWLLTEEAGGVRRSVLDAFLTEKEQPHVHPD